MAEDRGGCGFGFGSDWIWIIIIIIVIFLFFPGIFFGKGFDCKF